VGQA
jgi:hypothetical protein